MRDVQLQVQLGIQKPNQSTTTDAQAIDAAASVGTWRVGSQVAIIAAAQVVAASASRKASDRRAAESSSKTVATPKAGAASDSSATVTAHFAARERQDRETGDDQGQPEREERCMLPRRHHGERSGEQRGARSED